jgi:hypothetical protein
MDKPEIKIETVPGTNEIIIREGQAKPIKDPEKINFTGHLFAPADFMENRKTLLKKDDCHLIVDNAAGSLSFLIDERCPHRHILNGVLKKANVISLFGINGEKFYSDKELAKFLRNNIFYFCDAAVHAKIIKSLMNFGAKITTVIENNSNNRGNVKQLFEQAVKSDVPESFNMKAPIFEGYPDLVFEVLIGAEADSAGVRFFLESPTLFKLEEEFKRQLLGVEVKRFEEFGCAILNK